MTYATRLHQLSAQFKLGHDTRIEDRQFDIRYCDFNSKHAQPTRSLKSFTQKLLGDRVPENEHFVYPVFKPSGPKRSSEVIILLHGLNERSWNKYLPWAEYLCEQTGKAVLLFPIAYHVNRSPSDWSNPRFLQKILDMRRSTFGADRSLSFANVALSERLTEHPERFYQSGRQSYYDLVQLVSELREGRHPLFSENTQVDVFAYSIGALLSQVLFLSNPGGLFDDSRLFMLCGGAVFNRMYGESRSIMDRCSYEKLLEYYEKEWPVAEPHVDGPSEAFYSMIAPHFAQQQRIDRFEQMKHRISGVSLANDRVIPYQGVVEAMGQAMTSERISLIDMPFDYTHENPFPVNPKTDAKEVNQSFLQVFKQSVAFFA